MGRIHWGRVAGGGLLAGLLMIILDIPFGLLMMDRFQAAMTPAQVAAMRKPGVMAAHMGWAFVLGLVLVWIYAAIRPRFGPGPKTALRAAFVVWLLAHVTVSLALATMDYCPDDLMTYSAVWGLVRTAIAGLAGAWIYKEA
jgi:hypothetical protein